MYSKTEQEWAYARSHTYTSFEQKYLQYRELQYMSDVPVASYCCRELRARYLT
jgi:hypothetical protein